MERYKKLEISGNKDSTLGEGAYGVVYKALDLVTNRHVALKKIRLEIEEEGIPTTALREMTLLRHLEHPNVVKLQNVVMEPARLYLIFELIDTDLKKFMDSSDDPLPPDLVQSYTAQMLSGIAHCHSLGVMHRDLKPQNILVTRDGGLKIADFGLARCFTPNAKPLTVEVITRWYRAPEILLGSNVYTSAVDLWSVGCIVVEMANKRAFLPGDSEIGQLFKIFRVMGTPSTTEWPQLATLPFWRSTFPEWKPLSLANTVPSIGRHGHSLLQQVFTYNPITRISAIEALEHPYIASVLGVIHNEPLPAVSPSFEGSITPKDTPITSLVSGDLNSTNFGYQGGGPKSLPTISDIVHTKFADNGTASVSEQQNFSHAGASSVQAGVFSTIHTHKVTPDWGNDTSAKILNNSGLASLGPLEIRSHEGSELHDGIDRQALHDLQALEGVHTFEPPKPKGKRVRRSSVSSLASVETACSDVMRSDNVDAGNVPKKRSKYQIKASLDFSLIDEIQPIVRTSSLESVPFEKAAPPRRSTRSKGK